VTGAYGQPGPALLDPSPAPPATDGLWLPGILREAARRSPDRIVLTALDRHGRAAATLTADGLLSAAGELAGRLRRAAQPGDRVLLTAMPELRFHVTFMACLLARMVPVPVPPVLVPSRVGPDGTRTGRVARLAAICADVGPAVAVVPGAEAQDLAASWAGSETLGQITVLPVEAGAAAGAPPEVLPPPEPDELAFIQYTSGSTSTPHGVMITHGAMLANQAIIGEHMSITPQTTMVSWLPSYHDMGLCLGLLLPLYAGAAAVVLTPETFLIRPERWLQAISAQPDVASAAPDFAYAWCARRVTGMDLAALDLSGWRIAVNGAEPVRADTLRSFRPAFADAGLSDRTMTPSYGLAESTLFVSGGSGDEEPVIRRYDRGELGAGRARRGDGGRAADGVEVVGCGRPGPGVRVMIVDPDTRIPRPSRTVGEIWVQSPSNGAGYWGRPDKSAETFRARLATSDGAREGDWLRTGDLGFFDDGELFVTGRRKDIIVIRGSNYYPQDFERLAQQAHPELAAGAAAAFAARDEARVIVVVETTQKRATAATVDTASAAVRAITAELPVTTEVLVVRRGQVPRTTSGKARRQECARRLRDGELAVLGRWPRDADGLP